ncbi:MAG: OmpA family protein [Rhodospirillales bacterium]|nr:OmpA family protein [Rhodospirillales bacterium]
MVEEGLNPRRKHGGFHLRGIATAIAVAFVLGGCSSVPDAVNPAKWYENTVDLFSGDDDQNQAAAEAQPAPGGDKEFPSLGTVPERPQASTVAERQQIAEGLVADREQRRYAPTVSRQGAPVNVLGEAPRAAAAPRTPSGVVPALPATPAPVAPVQATPAPRPAMPQPAPQTATAPARMAATPPPAPRVSLEPPPMPRPATAGAMTEPSTVAPRTTRPVPPANAAMPSTGAFDTVVISSTGIEQGGPGAQQSAPATAPRFGAPRMAMAPGAPARAVSRPAGPGRTGAQGSLKVATIQFSTGSAALDSRDRAILRNVVALQAERGGVIRVVGHASSRTANMDAVRHRMVNYQVSADRAQNVAQELIKLGAGADTVVVTAKSDNEPLYYEIMPSGEAGNRRAEIYLDF